MSDCVKMQSVFFFFAIDFLVMQIRLHEGNSDLCELAVPQDVLCLSSFKSFPLCLVWTLKMIIFSKISAESLLITVFKNLNCLEKLSKNQSTLCWHLLSRSSLKRNLQGQPSFQQIVWGWVWDSSKSNKLSSMLRGPLCC